MIQLHRNGYWLKVFVLLLCAVGTVIAEDPVADQPETTAAGAADPLDDNLKQLPETVIDETKELVSDWNNVWPLMLAGGASIVMHNSDIDREIAENFDLHHALGKEMDEVGYIVGGPGLHFAAAGLWYLVSDNNQDEFNRQRAWTMIEALSVTGATAWPSGHTSSSFTVAAVLDEFYGPEVGFWSYLGAGFIGYRMMDSGDHWASDVVFGGVLGYLIGHQIGGKHMKLEVGGFNVVPINTVSNDEHIVGIGLAKRF